MDVSTRMITLTRDGARDLEFPGELIGDASSRRMGGQNQSRWQEFEVYRHDDGRYVLSVRSLSQWIGEEERCDVTICASPSDLLDALSLGQGFLSGVARTAWYDACENDSELARIKNETI